MPNTATVYARIDPQLKEDVDSILATLHVTPSALIQMLYGQIKLTKRIPFDIMIPTRKPVYVDDLTLEDLNLELSKGFKSIEHGEAFSTSEVDEKLKKELGM